MQPITHYATPLPRTTVREAVGLFDSIEALQRALNDLEENGFRREEISVLASEDEVRAKLSAQRPDLHDIMENPATPRAVFIPQEVLREGMASLIGVPLYFGAAMGALVILINAAVDSARWPVVLFGALIGGLMGAAIGGAGSLLVRRWWQYNIQRQLNNGGMVVWVNISMPEQEPRAWHVLSRNKAHHVHVHEIAAG